MFWKQTYSNAAPLKHSCSISTLPAGLHPYFLAFLKWQQERVSVIISVKCGKFRSMHFLQSVLTVMARAIQPLVIMVRKQELGFTLRVSSVSPSTVRFSCDDHLC